ncbi:MAG: hypothetical protein J6D31_08205 [Clostridia bacterium]|nr:hypothetical protein [Clostridia bacterium]
MMNVKLTRHLGRLKVDINGKLYEPLSFKSFRPNPTNISEFYAAGVRLFSVLTTGLTSALGVPYSLFGESWIGEEQYDFSPIDKQMDMFLENAPDGYFAPMIQVDTRDWYLKAHPDKPNSFTHLSQIAHDGEWRRAAAAYVKAAIRHCEEKYGEHIYGYFLLGGTTTEWFSHGDREASHPIKEAGYRKWTGDDGACLPSLERLNREGPVFLEQDEDDVYQARRFHAETISDLILYFAGEAQAVIRHQKLLGVYFGYLFELGGERLYNDGSLDYERVFFSPDIDMISSPSAYEYRKIDDPSAFMVTQKTLDDHNKLYFLEFDHITHVAPEEIRDGLDVMSSNRSIVKIPGSKSKCKNETESLNLMYRDFILCNANRAALWWFDMFDGWFRSDGMMAAVSHMLKLSKSLGAIATKSVAQIAVIAEGSSMYRARKSARLATESLSNIRRTLAACGGAYDLYSMGDCEAALSLPYKLYVFVNQYDLPDPAAIHARLRSSGKSALWLYAPAYATDGQLSVSAIQKATGICVSEKPSSNGGMIFADSVIDYGLDAPYFNIEDSHATPLAYFENGAVAVAYRELEGYRSVYASTCNLPAGLLRQIAADAGAFVYSDNDRVYVYPNSASVGVYNATDGDTVIHLPEDGVYMDMIEGRRYTCKDGNLHLAQKPIRSYLLIKEEQRSL